MAFSGLFDIAGLANAFIEKQVAARKASTPPKTEYLYGCAGCNYSEAGCKHCHDTPFASRPIARAKPDEGRYHNTLPAAPTFYPTGEEWEDPFAYLGKIAPEATKAGIALIVPPKGWEPPIQMLDQETGQLRTDLQVPVRIQPTHLLCRRWPTPAGAPPDKKKRPQHSGSESGEDDYSDAGEDEQQAAAATPKKSNAVTGRCSKAGMQQHKAALAAAAAAADEDGDEDGQREVIINPAHLDAVATAAQASDGQFGYEHLEEPLSLFDFHRYADWAKRRHFNGPVMTGLRQQEAAAAADEQQQQGEQQQGEQQQQEKDQRPPVVSASTAWRSWPATGDVRAARGVAGRYGPAGGSGSNSGAAGSSGSNGSSSEWEEPSVDEVEAEFWRIVEAAEEQVEALYGQDIDTATYCSAFPTIRELAERQSARLLKGAPNKQQDAQRFGCVQELAKIIGASEQDDPCNCVSMCDCGTCQLCVLRAYAAHPWNINNIPQAKGSVLRFVREDVGGKPITGLMVPWVYVGSCFSAFCWHIEDHGLYSINYNHMGSPKIWYGVPAAAAAALDASMRDALPHLFDKDHLLLHKLITMLSPAQLAARGVPVCRAVQVPGSFIITFPDAYHAGFNSGFNVAEAVNFAAPDWLPFGSSSVVRYRNEERYMTFSHDQMLINVVKEAIAAAAGKPPALPAPSAAAAAAEDADAAEADKPAVLRCALKQQFRQQLEATVTELGDAEAAAAEREWWQAGSSAVASTSAAAAAAASARAVRMVAPPGVGGSSDGDGCSGSSVPPVDFCSNPLDSTFWWSWYPEETWTDAAAVADEAAAEALHRAAGQVDDAGPHTPSKQQQAAAGEGHHLAAASVQHHGQGQRERVFTMRGAVGGGSSSNQQQQQEGSEDEDGGIVPGMPAAGAKAAAAAAGPPPRVVAAAARSLALAAFAPTADQPAPPPQQQQQPPRKQAPSKKSSSSSSAAAAVAAAATAAVESAPKQPSVAERVEAAVKAVTTYTLCLAEARRQKLLVWPPSANLAREALGELALRVELEQQRQAALLLKAGISRASLMIGNSAATDKVSGVHVNTQGVECAVCGCDLSLASVVSSEEPGRAVCPAHAPDLDGPRSSAWLLLRYPPGYLDRLVATGLSLIPGAAESIAAARKRQSWVAAGRFFGGAVLHRGSHAAPAAAAAPGGVIPALPAIKQEAAAAAAALQQQQGQPAAAAAGVQESGQEQQRQWKERVPVIEVKLLGRLYDPDALSKKLFEDLEASGGESSQSLGWDEEDGEEGDFVQQPRPQQQQQQQRGGADVKPQQQGGQQQQEGDSGGDASSGDWWQEEAEAEDAFGFYTFGADGAESEDGGDGDKSDDDFRPSAARKRKPRRRPAAGAPSKRSRGAGDEAAAAAAVVKVEQQQVDGSSPDVVAA